VPSTTVRIPKKRKQCWGGVINVVCHYKPQAQTKKGGTSVWGGRALLSLILVRGGGTSIHIGKPENDPFHSSGQGGVQPSLTVEGKIIHRNS